MVRRAGVRTWLCGGRLLADSRRACCWTFPFSTADVVMGEDGSCWCTMCCVLLPVSLLWYKLACLRARCDARARFTGTAVRTVVLCRCSRSRWPAHRTKLPPTHDPTTLTRAPPNEQTSSRRVPHTVPRSHHIDLQSILAIPDVETALPTSSPLPIYRKECPI